jgi:hypothetical protein
MRCVRLASLALALAPASCASLGGLSGASDDAGADPTHFDATPSHDATTYHDAAVDVGRDSRTGRLDAHADALRDAGIDAGEDVCHPPPPDAMPEGGGVPNPGSVECNGSLPPDAGGYCDTRAGQFCCRGAQPPDGGPRPPTQCELGTGAGAANLATCLANDAPVECDETADCPDASICCFAANPDPSSALRGQYLKLCAPPGSDGGCDLAAAYPAQLVGSTQIRLCKKDYECGPCGACNMYCCEGVSYIEACESPSTVACRVGLCSPDAG